MEKGLYLLMIIDAVNVALILLGIIVIWIYGFRKQTKGER